MSIKTAKWKANKNGIEIVSDSIRIITIKKKYRCICGHLTDSLDEAKHHHLICMYLWNLKEDTKIHR